MQKIVRGSLSSEESGRVAKAMDVYRSLPIRFYDRGRMDTATIRAKIKILRQTEGIDLVVLDGLLQLDKRRDPRKFEQQWAYLMGIMDDLEAISKEFDIPILASHQISRNPGGRSDKRPQLTDLGHSSAVEQKSSNVLLMYRPAAYGITEEDGKDIAPGYTEIRVAKNRHGQEKMVKLRYDDVCTRFLDW